MATEIQYLHEQEVQRNMQSQRDMSLVSMQHQIDGLNESLAAHRVETKSNIACVVGNSSWDEMHEVTEGHNVFPSTIQQSPNVQGEIFAKQL